MSFALCLSVHASVSADAVESRDPESRSTSQEQGAEGRSDEESLRPLDRKSFDLQRGDAKSFDSAFLEGASVLVLPGVFLPKEAEKKLLPFMREHATLFAGRTVLEIGTGTGIISVYAAQLGAKKVVATDISAAALDNAARNAKRFGVEEIVETRLVPPTDISAYSVIGPDEAFDIIISNPPYSLDLEADENTAVTDRGDLGFSIVRGLETHLKPRGTAVLLYGSFFYHHVMVKFARHLDFEVTNHEPFFLSVLEAETVFNAYLARLLEREQIAPSQLRFDLEEDEGLRRIRIQRSARGPAPLLPGGSAKWFHGMIVIQRKPPADESPR